MAAAAAALITLGVFLGSCADGEEELAPMRTGASPTPDATEASTITPSPTRPPSTPVGPTFRYTDPTYGYSFDYPASWYLSTPKETGGDLVLRSYDPTTVPPIGGPVPKDKLKVLIWVAEGVNKPLADWLSEGKNSPGQVSPPVVLSQSTVTLGGKTGLVEFIESEGARSAGYFIPLGGGRVFVINAIPSGSELWLDFERVLASIKLAP
jgi:hypothetical protein